MGTSLPVDHHPQAPAIGVTQCDQGGVDPAQMRWAMLGLGQQHAEEQRAHTELARTDPDGQEGLD